MGNEPRNGGNGAQTSIGTMSLVATGSISITITGAQALGIGIGILMFSKPNSGRIRFQDGTGYTDNGRGGKRLMTEEEAREAYQKSKDRTFKEHLKAWMKQKGYRTSHLK